MLSNMAFANILYVSFTASLEVFQIVSPGIAFKELYKIYFIVIFRIIDIDSK